MVACFIHDTKFLVLPIPSKECFYGCKCLFNGIQVWGIRGQEDKLAIWKILQKLIYDA